MKRSLIFLSIVLAVFSNALGQTVTQYFSGTYNNATVTGSMTVSPNFAYEGQGLYCGRIFSIDGPIYQSTGTLTLSGPGFQFVDKEAVTFLECDYFEELTFPNSSFYVECDPTFPASAGADGTPHLPVVIPAGCSGSITAKVPNIGSITLYPTGSANSPIPKLYGDPANKCPCSAVGEPIDTSTGNVFEKESDYTAAGPNALAFIRYYNSQADPSTLASDIGTKWRTNFDRYLRIVSADFVIAEQADGRELNFNLANGVWSADTDVDATLTDSGSTWVLTNHDDSVETYAKAGSTEALLSSVRFRNGYTQTLTRNPSNQITQVTDSYGRSLVFKYASGLLNTVTTPDGLVLTYGYTSSGVTAGVLDRLASVMYSTSPQTGKSYLYEDTSFPFALTGVTDEDLNRYVTWGYDALGRAVSNFMGTAIDESTIVYDDTTGNRTVTNALGQPSIYKFTTLQGVPKLTEIDRQATATTTAATKSFTYDSNGYFASQTDWNGNLTTFVNNSHGLPTAIDEASGTSVARTTSITYDATWVHLPDTIQTAGLTVAFKYNDSGEVLTKALTDTTTTTTPYSTNAQTRTWTNTWSNSLLASVQTPNGNTTTYAYDSTGALISITDVLKHLTTITSHTGGGYPEIIVDPNSVTTTIAYNPRMWRTSSTVSGTTGSYKTTWAYDAAGNLTKTTLPDGSYLVNSYDAAHRLTQVTDALGNYTMETLDGLGDRTATNVYTGKNALTWKRSGTFDALGRELVETGGAGQATTRTYDSNGNVLTVEDALSHTTTYTYDALNRLSTSKDQNKGITTSAYNTHDLVVSVTDANGNTTAYVRDGFGDVIQQSSPDSGITVYHYDGDANLTSKTDALKIVTNQTFDALDRPLTTTYPADTAENVAYTYDQTGTGFSFGIGRLTSVTDASGSLTRTYEERGDLLSEVRVNGKTTLATGYTYDGANRVATMTYPDGTLVTYSHDAAGNVSTVTGKPAGSSTTTTLATLTHAPFGPMNSAAYGNGTYETWTLDASYRPTNITDTLSVTNVQNLTYKYDLANNVSSITDANNAANTQSFGYDGINRLLTAGTGTGGYGTYTWTYDNVGNRLTQANGPTSIVYGYVAGSNRLASIVATTITAHYNPDLTPRPKTISRSQVVAAHLISPPPIPTIQPGPTAKRSHFTLADTLGWPMLFGGLAGIVGCRRRLRHNSWLAFIVVGLLLTDGATLILGCGSSNHIAPTPTFSPAGGTYASTQTVTISDSGGSPTIYYTTNGTSPTTSSAQYTAPIAVAATETIQAMATVSGEANSSVASAAYTINLPPAAVPTFSPAAKASITPLAVTIAETTAGASIFYTTNGSTPTVSSTPYSGPITVSSNETIEAIAVATGYSTSPVATAVYTITPPTPTPTLSLAAGTYTGTQTLAISDSATIASIYYTTNGTSPTSSSTLYTGPISISQSETVEAVAVAAGDSLSATASAAYTIDLVLDNLITTNANGNITGVPTADGLYHATYSYNNANRPASVTGTAMAASFVYDWEGQRYSKTDGGSQPTLYSYSKGGAVIAENDGGAVTDYIYVDGRPIAVIQPTATPTANQVNYVMADRLGTPQLVTNSSGTAVWSTTYQAFGTTGTVNASIEQNLRFPGQLADPETGFSYNLNRDYMPNLGRYMEGDPAGLLGGTNPYDYSDDNSINYIDPLGLDDINLFPAGSPQSTNIDTVQSPPGIFTVGGHGNPFVVAGFTPQQLANRIRSNPNYTPGETVRLDACNSGTDPGNGNQPFAQDLANLLKSMVMAPNNFAWIYPNQTPVVAPYSNQPNLNWQNVTEETPNTGPDLAHPGGYLTFKPN